MRIEIFAVTVCECCYMTAASGMCCYRPDRGHEPLCLLADDERLVVSDEWASWSDTPCLTCGDTAPGDRYNGLVLI
jgi:hypothetical protein